MQPYEVLIPSNNGAGECQYDLVSNLSPYVIQLGRFRSGESHQQCWVPTLTQCTQFLLIWTSISLELLCITTVLHNCTLVKVQKDIRHFSWLPQTPEINITVRYIKTHIYSTEQSKKSMFTSMIIQRPGRFFISTVVKYPNIPSGTFMTAFYEGLEWFWKLALLLNQFLIIQ